jgi:uncharacterized protein YaaN involved in tellurite resistance
MSEPRPLFNNSSAAAPPASSAPAPAPLAVQDQGTAQVPAVPVEVRVAPPLPAATDEAIATLGRAPLERVSGAADKLLEMSRTGEIGAMGERLGELVVVARGLDPDALRDKGFLRRLFGSAKAVKERFFNQYRSVSTQIDKLVDELQRHAGIQASRIGTLETMFAENEAEYHELGEAVATGQAWAAELARQVDALSAQPARDALAAQVLADERARLNRLEKRIHDLKIAQTLALQTAPQIRLMQQNARMLVTKFEDLVNVTVPAWKKQFSLQILLAEQEQSAKVAGAVDEATNEAIRRNAELLKQNAGDIARAGNRALVDIETLQHSQAQLLEAIGEVKRITDEARVKRGEGEKQLVELQRNLLTALTGKATL